MSSQSKLTSDRKSLLKCFALLDKPQRAMLLAFAEFLVARNEALPASSQAVERTPVLPKKIARPRKETVIGAIKRLSETYYMLDRSELLTEASSLMSAHIMHGREAVEVIDDLEALFATYYQQHQSDSTP
ncbi:MAG: hypothetical protein KDI63_03280 [Gammaproteobacteria bacterium]|nr:hypothetical protein [Gammaproteobacteria bacterium]